MFAMRYDVAEWGERPIGSLPRTYAIAILADTMQEISVGAPISFVQQENHADRCEYLEGGNCDCTQGPFTYGGRDG